MQWHQHGSEDGQQQRAVEDCGTRKPNAPCCLDGEIHRTEDSDEYHRVHKPGGSEQERKLNNALRFEKEECGSHEEEVRVRRHPAEGARRESNEGRSRSDNQTHGQKVETRDLRLSQVEERVIVPAGWRNVTDRFPWLLASDRFRGRADRQDSTLSDFAQRVDAWTVTECRL
jgi:hypothetical protein